MRVRTAHISLQFSDTDRQHTHDIEKVFDRAVERRYDWITGTEAGVGAGNMSEELLRIARSHDYRPWIPSIQAKDGPQRYTDCWIAVRRGFITGNWSRGYEQVIPGSRELYSKLGQKDVGGWPKWGPKGLVWVSFDSLEEIGEVNIGAAHYLTGAHDPKRAVERGVNHWEWNEKLGRRVGSWAREVGKGPALVWYAGDQNMADNRNDHPEGDTFFGEPLTSTWDELKKYENTGHGTIDVIATYNRDARVSALKTNALNDREFFLHTDHFLVEAVMEVAPRKR